MDQMLGEEKQGSRADLPECWRHGVAVRGEGGDFGEQRREARGSQDFSLGYIMFSNFYHTPMRFWVGQWLSEPGADTNLDLPTN